MDSKAQEIQGGFKWLLFAGTAAILLSLFLFYVDDVVMRHAPDRDREHAAQMAELRKAQASLPARVTDDRQTLPLKIEQESNTEDASATAHSDHDSHGH
jgi:hypothetical protein